MKILRRIKNGFKKLVEKNKDSKSRMESSAKEPVKAKTEVQKEEKIAWGIEETAVERTKFYASERIKPVPRQMPQDLPYGYGKDKLVLQVRDSWWIHAYWEVTGETFDRLKERLGAAFYSAKKVLRVYDVSHILFDGKNAHRFFDIEVNDQSNNWYIDTAGPGRSWCVDYGLRLANNEFITIIRSNTVYTPIEGPSWITDEEWMVPEEIFARLYGMGFGFGRSSPVGKAWQERIRRELFSGILASPGITSVASPVRKIPRVRKFWLVVNTELIVYGATEPDANVTVQGRPITLRPDGTFSLRFALPDGKQVIPVAATSSDKVETRVITPIVNKETR